MLESAIAAGLASCGVDVLLAGVVPTPAIAYLTPPASEKDYADFMARFQMHRAKLDAMKILYRPFENELAVFGEWKPNEIGQSFVPREWDLTAYLTRARTCEVTFQYSSGKHRLDISKAELLENGAPVSSAPLRLRGEEPSQTALNLAPFTADPYSQPLTEPKRVGDDARFEVAHRGRGKLLDSVLVTA